MDPNESDLKPREHHYLFAHGVLPTLFYHDPIQFVAICNLAGGTFVADTWKQTGIDYVKEPAQRLRPVGLQATPIETPPVLGTLIVLPDPERVAEAHMVLAVGTLKKRRFRQPILHKPKFFTLEYGLDDGGDRITVLCSWSKDQAHSNHGDGPPPTREAFVQACRDIMRA